MKTSIFFHTNIPSPYRQHQFELIARVLPGAVFYFTETCNPARPWKVGFDGWQCDCRLATPWMKVKALFLQRWGTIHVLAYPGSRLYHRLLVFSGLIGHSKVVQWNDAGFEEIGSAWRRRGLFYRLWHLLWVRSFSAVYTAGVLGAKFAVAMGFDRRKVVNTYFSHDMDAFVRYRDEHYQEARDAIRTKLQIGPQDVSILNISRYLDWKRLEDLAEALILTEKMNPECAARLHLILIGDGEWKAHLPLLKQLKIVRVHLIHQMPPDDVLAYYCAADLFAFPSEGDIWGLVVNEALSMGVPVVCCDCIGAAELVQDGINGYRIKARSPEQMAQRIQEIAVDEKLRQCMAQAALRIKDIWRTELGIRSLLDYFGIEGEGGSLEI